MIPVAIVIPVYNAAATLAACVRAVFNKTDHPDWRLVVVDDGSTDGAVDELQKTHPDITVITRRRGGVAGALNAAIAHPATAGRDVVRLHADVIVETADWLNQLVAVADASPRCGVVGARLVYPDGRIQSEGRAFVTGLGMHPRHYNLRAYLAEGAAGAAAEVDAVSGALAYYRREVIDAVGGFDESYGLAWMEDDDFCMAARHRGFSIHVQPAVCGVHYTRSASPVFQAKIPGSEKLLASVTGQLRQSATQIQSAQWEAKWGWNPLYPDMSEIRRLHGETAITWRVGEALRYKPVEEFPPVDCALVTWNSLKLLRRTLDSLALTDYPADKLHVYVADNGSSDATPAYLQELKASYRFPLHVLTLPLNTGVAAGINTALLAGKSELVARLDDDIELPPEWLKIFVSDLRNRPFAGCVATKTVNDIPARTLQWACPHSYPNGYNYRDETDEGQADYVARVAAIHGCCILYRRDTIKRCGVFDIRYSPTQYDDIDHNFALVQAGYEVLYDGRTHVVHKISTGLDRSFAGMASASANGSKMYGKWGADIFERLDSSIVLSREGRYLPDDGDTTAWLAAGPAPEDFPRNGQALTPGHHKILEGIYDTLALRDGTDGALLNLARVYLTRGRQLMGKGFFMDALDVFLTTCNFFPTSAEAFAELAASYHRLGYLEQAKAAARRGLHLAPENTTLAELSLRPAQVKIDAPVVRATPSSGSPRILMVNAFQPRLPVDDVELMQELAAELRAGGAAVDIACTARPDPRGYDVVHVWNTSFPYQTLAQLTALRVAAPDIPVCLTPLYADLRESRWFGSALTEVLRAHGPAGVDSAFLRAFARGVAPLSGEARPVPRQAHLYRPPTEACQRRIVELADLVLPGSEAEWVDLQRELGGGRDHRVLPLQVDAARLRQASPEWFHAHHGRRDFVLTVGGLDAAKNQLLLIEALRGTGLPLVIVGHHRNSDYAEICVRQKGVDVLFIENLAPEELASAYRAARVYAAPSFQDCRFRPAVEAAVAGCSLVLAQRPAEQEYFGAVAQYCNPADVVSIRNAVVSAHRAHAMTAERRKALAEHLSARCDLAAVARELRGEYERLLVGKKTGGPILASV